MPRSRNLLLVDRRLNPATGVLVTIAMVAIATLLVYPLKTVAPVLSLGVVYLLGVLLVSTYLGFRLGLLASVLSAAAFNWFHIPPLGRFTIGDSQNGVALAAFGLAAAIASTVAELARSRASEADQRRREADLAAELARVLLAGRDREVALAEAAELVAGSVGADRALIELGPVQPTSPKGFAYPLESHAAPFGWLVIRGRLEPAEEERLRERVVPAVQALLAVSLERDTREAEKVETAALRRGDVLKTAILRSVSHDLRSPLTAIVTTGHALLSSNLRDAERLELAQAIVDEGERLSLLVEKLLDLSRLEAGSAAPHLAELAVEDVLEAVVERGPGQVRLQVADGLPLIRADGAQLERAFANLVENAVHHSGGRPVQIRAATVGRRLVVRVVDQGRGISEVECRRIFEPFYRGPDTTPGTGLGLGLAIAKGFVEVNGGTLTVESVPRQGTSFVVLFPLEQPDTVLA